MIMSSIILRISPSFTTHNFLIYFIGRSSLSLYIYSHRFENHIFYIQWIISRVIINIYHYAHRHIVQNRLEYIFNFHNVATAVNSLYMRQESLSDIL